MLHAKDKHTNAHAKDKHTHACIQDICTAWAECVFVSACSQNEWNGTLAAITVPYPIKASQTTIKWANNKH